MKNIVITMRLFGAFRQYGDAVELVMAAGSPVSAIKKALNDSLEGKAQALIEDSVLCDDQTILPDDHVFDRDARLAILPPVCGG
jgi:molybdopterin converting factor small subunit